MISAKVIKDSVSPEGIRLTTVQCRYPRMIHSEVMTHRVFSRNGRSSRAVPVATLIKEASYTPHFMKNKPGMAASEELSLDAYEEAVAVWNCLAEQTRQAVTRLNELGVHKQWANRPLEAFGYIDVLITSTDWANFFALRDEVGAQPEIDAVAKAIKETMATSEPYQLNPGQWHMPYIAREDYNTIHQHIIKTTGRPANFDEALEIAKKISTARCARLTIRPFDGDGSIEKELARYEKLMVSRPVHASPAEHIATPDSKSEHLEFPFEQYWLNKHEWGNFYGWRQFRKTIPYNTINDER